eukprot:CAMPEP_0179190154 /NCGR_PEP_ID=MMETSP0796-20121207/94410_1 /TAXON_ID=73915 /ORGANISM="Pyrodinium bahamense, Strain pbaha01" /LENGTH=503 /DNA_ID=CAMNT_0020894309 /DNA_START=70 /DNA_END=1581 /DNA_ORIENTATION=-
MALVPNGGGCEQMRMEVEEFIAAGNAVQALIVAERGLEQFEAAGDKRGEASALYMQALAQSKINEDDPGAVLFVAQKALTALKEAGEKTDVAAATLMVGELYCANGELEEASRAARDASTLYQELGDGNGTAACSLLASDLHLMRDEADDAILEAEKAYKAYVEDGNISGKASAMHKQARAHRINGNHMESLRAAEQACKLWHSCQDLKNEAAATVTEAEAKISVVEERDEKGDTNVFIMQLVMTALGMAKKHRKRDNICLLLNSNGLKGATQAAREACKCFRKAGLDHHVARATLIWATAEYKLNLLEDAKERCQRVLGMFERTIDEDGKMKAMDLMDDINYELGLPTRAEIAEVQERQRQFLMQQQQYAMMQQQQQFQGMQMMQPVWQQAQPQEEVQQASKGPVAFNREGSPLEMSAGMDPSIIRNKVAELAGAIIGDTEELEVDTPLMEAGLTSNSAVLLRDELTKDLPGINLPPTLIFDYPSVAAIADFVVEASKKLKK